MAYKKTKTRVGSNLRIIPAVKVTFAVLAISFLLDLFLSNLILNGYALVTAQSTASKSAVPAAKSSDSCLQDFNGPVTIPRDLVQIGQPKNILIGLKKITATCYGIGHDRTPAKNKFNVIFVPSNFSKSENAMDDFARFAATAKLGMIDPAFGYASEKTNLDDPTQSPDYGCFYKEFLQQKGDSISPYDAPGLMDFYLVNVNESPDICEKILNNDQFVRCGFIPAEKLSSACFEGSRDTIVIDYNDAWGGSGIFAGGCNHHVAVVSTQEGQVNRGRITKIARHEAAHTIFSMADEYTDSNNIYSYTFNSPNCASGSCSPWQDLIDAKKSDATKVGGTTGTSGSGTCQAGNCLPTQCTISGSATAKTVSNTATKSGGEKLFPDAVCQSKRCSFGFAHTGAAISTMFSQNFYSFGSVDERIVCCRYLNKTGTMPENCRNKFGDTYVNAKTCKKALADINIDCPL